MILTLVGAGIAANMTAMAWTMRTLYHMRHEISDAHGRHDEQLKDLNGRVFRLERLWD